MFEGIIERLQAFMLQHGGTAAVANNIGKHPNKFYVMFRGETKPTRLYWHLARKTFADRCLNVRLMSVEATTKAMGQSSLNSIKPYAKTDERRVLKEFK